LSLSQIDESIDEASFELVSCPVLAVHEVVVSGVKIEHTALIRIHNQRRDWPGRAVLALTVEAALYLRNELDKILADGSYITPPSGN